MPRITRPKDVTFVATATITSKNEGNKAKQHGAGRMGVLRLGWLRVNTLVAHASSNNDKKSIRAN